MRSDGSFSRARLSAVHPLARLLPSAPHSTQRQHLQEDGRLILLSTPESCPHPTCKLFGSAHGTAFLAAIGTFDGGVVCVD